MLQSVYYYGVDFAGMAHGRARCPVGNLPAGADRWEVVNVAAKQGPERLDKLIAGQTALSRRDVHKLFSRGQVLLNGAAVRAFDAKADPERDVVTVDGRQLCLQRYRYLMLNKPKGVVCATKDAVLPTVLDLVPEELQRSGLFPAGRLDKDTEGFVLITNDGEFAHRILSPKSHVPKLYTAGLDRPIDADMIRAFGEGMTIGGERCLPAGLEAVGGDPQTARVELRQGMYHQIKRMFGAFGVTVVTLRREKIGGLELDPALEAGKCRELSQIEVTKITEE